MEPDRSGTRWAPYLPPTSRAIVGGLREARASGPLSVASVRDQYALLHLPVLLRARGVDDRARLFVDLFRWAIHQSGLSREQVVIVDATFFPANPTATIEARYRAAASALHDARLSGDHPLSTKQILDREAAAVARLADFLLDPDLPRQWVTRSQLDDRPPPPADPYYGLNSHWREWRIVLDRRTGSSLQYCYYNVLLEAVRSPTRFLHVGYTSGDSNEPDDPVHVISSRAGHVQMKPVRDDKPTQSRSQQYIDAVYFGRTLDVGDVERVKYRRTLTRDIGETSWAAFRSLADQPYVLDMRILLGDDEPIRSWREECWSTQSPDAKLLHERDHYVRGQQPRLVQWSPKIGEPGRLYKLVIR